MFHSVIFLLEQIATHITIIRTQCVYQCGKNVSESVDNDKVQDSAICYEVIDRQACNSHLKNNIGT